jgi:hypothetical protein
MAQSAHFSDFSGCFRGKLKIDFPRFPRKQLWLVTPAHHFPEGANAFMRCLQFLQIGRAREHSRKLLSWIFQLSHGLASIQFRSDRHRRSHITMNFFSRRKTVQVRSLEVLFLHEFCGAGESSSPKPNYVPLAISVDLGTVLDPIEEKVLTKPASNENLGSDEEGQSRTPHRYRGKPLPSRVKTWHDIATPFPQGPRARRRSERIPHTDWI